MSGSVALRVKGRRLSVPWNEVMGFRPMLYGRDTALPGCETVAEGSGDWFGLLPLGPRLPAFSILVAEFRKVYTFSSTRDHLIPKRFKV